MRKYGKIHKHDTIEKLTTYQSINPILYWLHGMVNRADHGFRNREVHLLVTW